MSHSTPTRTSHGAPPPRLPGSPKLPPLPAPAEAALCPVCTVAPVPEGRVNCSRRCTARAADMRRRGVPIDTPRKNNPAGQQRICVSLPTPAIAWLVSEAKRRGLSRSRLVAEAVALSRRSSNVVVQRGAGGGS